MFGDRILSVAQGPAGSLVVALLVIVVSCAGHRSSVIRERDVRLEPAPSDQAPTRHQPSADRESWDREYYRMWTALFEGLTWRGPWAPRIALLRRAVDDARDAGGEKLAHALGGLGNMYKYAGEHRLAISTHEESCRLGLEEADCRFALGCDFVAASDLDRAEEHFARVVELADHLTPLAHRMALRALAIVNLKRGRPDLAQRYLQRARELLGPPDQEFFDRDAEVDLGRLSARALFAEGKVSEALLESDRARGGPLTRALLDEASGRSDPPLDAEGLVKLADHLGATLIEYAVEYDDDPGFKSIWTPNGFLRMTPHGLLRATHVVAWVISPAGRVRAVRTPIPDQHRDLGALLQELYATWGLGGVPGTTRENSGPRPEVVQSPEQLLRNLYVLLIQPILQFLPSGGGARLVIVPQDEIAWVPFLALPWYDGGAQKRGALVDGFAISLATSLGNLQLQTRRTGGKCADRSGALILGDPQMPTLRLRSGALRKLPALPGARSEALTAAKLVGSRALLGANATKTAVRSRIAKAALIHFATHGIVDDFVPSFSALALAPSPGDSGFLERREILSARLCAEIAILSACATGLGLLGADGLASLADAFMIAGVPRVLMALWNIDDGSSVEFSRSFYRALLLRGDGGDEAARFAALEVRKRYPDPRHWAAMSLTGLNTPVAARASLHGDVTQDTASGSEPGGIESFPVPQGAFGFGLTKSGDGHQMMSFQLDGRLETVNSVVRFYVDALRTRGLDLAEQRGDEDLSSLTFRKPGDSTQVTVHVIGDSGLGSIVVSIY
jgi:CHAT domain-containing protein